PATAGPLQRKGSYKDGRRAAFILMRADPSAESNPDQAEIIKLAREILPDFQPEKAGVRLDPKKPTEVGDSAKDRAQSAKRQRSTDGGAPLAKKKKVQTQQSNRSFAEVTKGRTIIGVVDNGSNDGLIPKELWRRVVNELHGRFMEEMLKNGGPPPDCENAGWYQGSIKVIACQDARSVSLYKRMIASLGEVYPGASLEAVDWDKIPSNPRARVWLTEKPADPATILAMLKMCNPTLPTADWRVAKVEEAVGLRRQVVLTLNEETARILEGAGIRIKYGFEHVSVRIYKSDAKNKPGGIDLETDAQELDLGELTEEVRPEGMSDVEEDILEGYTSEESDLARALAGVGMEEDSLLGSDTEVTVVENLKDVSDIPADNSPSQ
ncbi:hypothetical protein KR067_009071, partial [Drosophila pandora]